MTSSNVSNLLVQVSKISIDVSDSKANVQDANGLFEKTLKNATESKESFTEPKAETKTNLDEKPVRKSEAYKSDKVVKLSKKTDEKVDESLQDSKEVEDLIESAVEEIKNVISKELDVKEEDIEIALENLGLVAFDLLNPQSLAEVVSEITGEEDSIALVMDENFKDILDSVAELTNQIFEEIGITLSEIKEVNFPVDGSKVQTIDLPVDENLALFDSNGDIVETFESGDVKPSEIKPEIHDVNLIDSRKDEPIQQESKVENDKGGNLVIDDITDNKNSSLENQTNNFSKDNSQPKESNANAKISSEPVIRADGMIFNEIKSEIQFLPEEQLVYLPSGEMVSSEEIVNQLVEQARILNSSEETTMEMTLNPEGLGKIYMEVTQRGDEITAKIFAENDVVKNALESQMANLRLELNQGSTKVTSIEVSVGAHEFERNLEEEAKRDEQRENQGNQSRKRNSRINLNSLDDLSGLMSDEDLLIAKMMQDNGNSLDFQA